MDTTEGSKTHPHCCACGQALRTGEPHWAGDREGRAWHYGCAEKAGLTYSWFNLGPFISPSSSPVGGG